VNHRESLWLPDLKPLINMKKIMKTETVLGLLNKKLSKQIFERNFRYVAVLCFKTRTEVHYNTRKILKSIKIFQDDGDMEQKVNHLCRARARAWGIVMQQKEELGVRNIETYEIDFDEEILKLKSET
jgi:hypothetical protein